MNSTRQAGGVRAVTASDRTRTAVDLTTTALREVTGIHLYRRNAFRITGLPTTASRKDVRQRQRQVVPAIDAGADVDLGHSLPVEPQEIRAAFDQLLERPHRRLVDEVLWLWGDETSDCGCPTSLHTDHDAAVLWHRDALSLGASDVVLTDNELVRAERRWSAAGAEWSKVLRRATFWTHVRARIAALDEPRLDESVVEILRDRVPRILFQPLIDLVAASTSAEERSWLTDRAHAWPTVSTAVVEERLEEVCATDYDDAEAAITKASTTLGDRGPDSAASIVYEQVVPRLDRLEKLVPHERHRRTARLRDMAGLVLNNCATALIDRVGPSARTKGYRWLRTARTLTSDPQAQRTIAANRAALDEMVTSFEAIERRVSELVAAGLSHVARSMLLDIKRQLSGAGGTKDLDHMLATLPAEGYTRNSWSTSSPYGEPDPDAVAGLYRSLKEQSQRLAAHSSPIHSRPSFHRHSPSDSLWFFNFKWWCRRNGRTIAVVLTLLAACLVIRLFGG